MSQSARSPGKRPSRETLTTVNPDGSRFFLHPAEVRGRFTYARRAVAAALIGLYASLPWIPINGHPAVFLDIAHRRFHLFGLHLAFQDTWLLFFLITGLGFSLFVVTALLGRVWCGWACPQTVFLDHVFRRVEYLFEGDASARRQLDAAPWGLEKALRRIGKHATFGLLSLTIAHIFLSYFVSLPELWKMMSHAPTQNWGAFVFVFAASGILYGNFAWFREQLCIIICPYGRFQSALVDDDSVTIGYDVKRGEPRGRPGIPDAGACVDCNRCVAVCPTGIDIRQGLQMECIACAACVDACDEVMTKLKRPTGLVRYDSLTGFRGGKRRILRPRLFAYAFFLIAGVVAAGIGFSTIRPAYAMAVRMPGTPYIVDDTYVRNTFQVRLINKGDHEEAFTVAIASGDRPVIVRGNEAPVVLAPLEEIVVPIVIQMRREDFEGAFTLSFDIQGTDKSYQLQRKIDFLGPDPSLLHGG